MLVGIARLAAEGELLEAKRDVEYFELPTRRFIGRCSSDRMPFEWTINPYRGCEFGCHYCYARYTHEFMELRDQRAFERKIYAKLWDEAAFRKELGRIPRGQAIAIGTATDPFQPAERRYGITRSMLKIFSERGGWRLWITTKSDLVARDVDLLRAVARRNELGVNVTVTTMDEHLARLLEPKAPTPQLRIAAVARLATAGIRAGVMCAPVLPLLNDSEPSIDAVAREAAASAASHFGGHTVFLRSCAKATFLPFLAEHFPRLVRRYRDRFESSPYLRGLYPEMIAERIRAARDRNGLARIAPDYRPDLWHEDNGQMQLFGINFTSQSTC